MASKKGWSFVFIVTDISKTGFTESGLMDWPFTTASHSFQMIFEISPLQAVLLTLSLSPSLSLCLSVSACARTREFLLTVFWFFALK